jgi:hypothetical protein
MPVHEAQITGTKNALYKAFLDTLRLLETRGHSDAVKWLSAIVFDIIHSDNFFGDDFHVLFAILPLQTYEAVREYIKNADGKSTFRAIAETLSEIGPFIRFVAVELKLEPDAQLTPEEKARKLKSFEIHTLVYRYIGVEGGYLGDFSYRAHHEFYIDLGLDINPYDYDGTTRERFMRILGESGLQVQAQILEGILDRFPVGSSELRTEERAKEIRSWLIRLRGAAPVPAPRPSITTEVVVRALADAELLIERQGATSGIDRLHTAFHGFL